MRSNLRDHLTQRSYLLYHAPLQKCLKVWAFCTASTTKLKLDLYRAIWNSTKKLEYIHVYEVSLKCISRNRPVVLTDALFFQCEITFLGKTSYTRVTSQTTTYLRIEPAAYVSSDSQQLECNCWYCSLWSAKVSGQLNLIHILTQAFPQHIQPQMLTGLLHQPF